MPIINGVGRVGIRQYVAVSPSPASSYLLDTYGGASTAYSLRKLSSTYTGSAIRVRRSSDNTEQNIGFDASGNLDTTTLLAFVGAGNGFVTTWYDQSGTGKDMTQATASSQPSIVSAGSLISRNGKPIIKFNNTPSRCYLGMNQPVSFDGSNHSFFMTYEKTGMENNAVLIYNSTNYLFLDYAGREFITNGGNTFYTTIPANSFKLISLTNTFLTSQKFYMNNSVIGTRSGQSSNGLQFSTIGSPEFMSTTIYTNELVTYPTDQASNISNINTNINSYYSIYPTYTTRTQAFATATGITDTTILNALNTFDTGLISNGLDTKMKAVYPFVGGTASAHKFNFMDARDLNAAFRLQFNGGWVHSSTGIKGNGTNTFANSFLTPMNVISNINSTSVSMYLREDNTNSGLSIYSANTITGNGGIDIWRYNSNTYYSVNSNEIAGPTNTTKGHYIATRIVSNQMKLIKGGSVISTSNTSVTNLPNNPVVLGGYGTGTSASYIDNTTYSFTHIGDGLTDTEAATFYSLVQTLQTSLGRQV